MDKKRDRGRSTGMERLQRYEGELELHTHAHANSAAHGCVITVSRTILLIGMCWLEFLTATKTLFYWISNRVCIAFYRTKLLSAKVCFKFYSTLLTIFLVGIHNFVVSARVFKQNRWVKVKK